MGKEEYIKEFSYQVKRRSDYLMNYFLSGFFITGLALAFYYETWLIAAGVGGLSLMAYYSAKLALPQSGMYQYVLSIVLGIFMAQFIYQMHGMFEMHFFAFIGSAVLITYHNWKLQLPLALVVLVHHGLFGYLQFIGVDDIYFTQLEYMDLQTFVIHGLLSACIFLLCGLWAYSFRKMSDVHIRQSFEIGQLQEADKQKEDIIAERKLAEESIRKSEVNLRAIFENTDVGFVLLERNTTIISFNKIAGEVFSESLNLELKAGNSYIESMPHDRRDFVSEVIKKVIEGMPVHFERSYASAKSNSVKWVLVNMNPVMDDSGRVIRICISLTNITERKISQQKLEEQNEELLKTNAELDRFVYSASHELRAPLSSVLGLIGVARLKDENPDTLKVLAMMQSSVQRLDISIQDIIQYSKNSRLQVEQDEIDFRELISDSIAHLSYMPETEKIRISTRVQGEAEFYSDRKRIAVVLNNLLSNAIKYHHTGRKDPFIEISVQLGAHTTQLQVRDNGPGIPAEYVSKIFNMFFRATEKKTGSGLGLYIVKEILDKMSGNISVESQEAVGTSFTVTIPNLYDDRFQSQPTALTA